MYGDKEISEFKFEQCFFVCGNAGGSGKLWSGSGDAFGTKPGQDFNALEPSVIIFICGFDPFDKQRYKYTFEHRCLEEELSLGDETRIIFFNTKGKNDDDVPEQLVHFLKYLENTTDTYVSGIQDEKVVALHDRVKTIKQSRKLEERYMQFEEMLNKREDKGRIEGEELKVIRQIKKKVAKDLAPEVIAEHLEEEDISFIRKVCRLLREHPQAMPEEILLLLSQDYL